MAGDAIQEGDYAVVDENGEKKAIVMIRDKGTMRVGKVQVSTAQLVGAPWGSMWELATDGATLQRVTEMPSQLGPKVDEIDKDNSQLVDRNDVNQALTSDDIEKLRREGKAGAEIIEALCTNSATFDTKTEFAQDKYKKRKAKKYVVRVTLRRPTARALCDSMFEKTAPPGQKTWNLRGDTLAQALALANVASGARVLVVEATQGLIAAAAAERLGGAGTVVAAAAADQNAAQVNCVRLMNFGEKERGAVHMTSLAALVDAQRRLAAGAAAAAAPAAAAAAAAEAAPAQNGAAAAAPAPAAAAAAAPAAADADMADAFEAVYASAGHVPSPQPCGLAAAGPLGAAPRMVAVVAAGTVETVPEAEGTGQQQSANGGSKQQQQQQQEEEEDGTGEPRQQNGEGGEHQQQQRHTFATPPEMIERLLQPGFSSCILAAPKLHAASLLRQVLPLLAPSAPFVVYSPWSQPLAEAMIELTKGGEAVMVQLTESWLREYQVLPGRTHPTMSTDGTGGFLLSGIKVIKPEGGPPGGGGRGGGGGGRGGGGRGGRGGGRAKRQRAG